jgi:hypothetical protein
MKTIEIATVIRPLSEYADDLGDEALILTVDAEPIAALVSLKGIDRESLALSTSLEFMALIGQARREVAEGRTISLEEMRRAVLEEWTGITGSWVETPGVGHGDLSQARTRTDARAAGRRRGDPRPQSYAGTSRRGGERPRIGA